MYNTAKTMYKQLFYGAGGNIYETYYGDTTTATPSADVQISPYAAGNTVISNCNFIVTSGAFKALSKRFTQLESPRHNLYNAAATMYKSVFYGGSTTINEEFFADSSNPTVSIVTTLAAPVGSTPLVANTGTYQVTAGTIDLLASSSITISSPFTPNYDARYGATGTGVSSSIGYVISSALSTNITINSVMTTLTNIQIPDVGVYQLNAIVVINNTTATAGTCDRVMVYVGYGTINNNTNNVATGQWSKLSFGTSVATGRNLSAQISTAYVVTSSTAPNNYLCLVAIQTGTSPFAVSAAPLTLLQVVRIA